MYTMISFCCMCNIGLITSLFAPGVVCIMQMGTDQPALHGHSEGGGGIMLGGLCSYKTSALRSGKLLQCFQCFRGATQSFTAFCSTDDIVTIQHHGICVLPATEKN